MLAPFLAVAFLAVAFLAVAILAVAFLAVANAVPVRIGYSGRNTFKP